MALKAMTTTSQPVQSQAPAAIAQFFRNCLRLGLSSWARITSATTSEMNGTKTVSRIATVVSSLP
jgi:hypothetical protein